VICFWGCGLIQRFVSWVAHDGEVCLFLKVGRCGFFNFPRNYSFSGVGWGGWTNGAGFFFLYFFVIW
jgi:hypothetical protein